jgi:hypothetical protein
MIEPYQSRGFKWGAILMVALVAMQFLKYYIPNHYPYWDGTVSFLSIIIIILAVYSFGNIAKA